LVSCSLYLVVHVMQWWITEKREVTAIVVEVGVVAHQFGSEGTSHIYTPHLSYHYPLPSHPFLLIAFLFLEFYPTHLRNVLFIICSIILPPTHGSLIDTNTCVSVALSIRIRCYN